MNNQANLPRVMMEFEIIKVVANRPVGAI